MKITPSLCCEGARDKEQFGRSGKGPGGGGGQTDRQDEAPRAGDGKEGGCLQAVQGRDGQAGHVSHFFVTPFKCWLNKRYTYIWSNSAIIFSECV